MNILHSLSCFVVDQGALSLIVLKYMGNEKHCKVPLIKIQLFTAPAAASSCSGCKVLSISSYLRNLEHVGFSSATIQAVGSNVGAMLNPSEVKENPQNRFKGIFGFRLFHGACFFSYIKQG